MCQSTTLSKQCANLHQQCTNHYPTCSNIHQTVSKPCKPFTNSVQTNKTAYKKCKSSAPQEHPPVVEGGWRERDEAAVSARAEPCNLHGAHHPYFVQAASCPRGGSRHHSCFDDQSQASALQARKVQRGRASRHGQQAVLHQLVGHVLAHRPRQEASDGLKRAGALFILVYLKFVLGLPKVCSVWMIQT